MITSRSSRRTNRPNYGEAGQLRGGAAGGSWGAGPAAQLVDLGRPALLGQGPGMADMTTVPDRARVRLPGISPRAYEHPADGRRW